MDKSAALSYIYAKASGNLGKSFTLERAHLLFDQKNLSDLWTLLFKTPVPLIPESMLTQKIEEEAFSRFISQYIDFVNMFDHPEKLLTDQLCIYEAENLKEVAAALCNGETKLPSLINLQNHTDLNFSSWPNLSLITKNSKFSWYNEVPSIHNQQKMDFRLDMQVIRHLWNASLQVKDESRDAVKHLFYTEFVIRNIIWALRLRIFYTMKKEDIIPLLIYVTESVSLEDPISAPALKVLDMPLDDFSVWQKWKYNELINPYVVGDQWKIDPTWMDRKYKVKMHKIAEKIFHQYPMTTGSLIGWFKIKSYEVVCIKMAVERLRLNISDEEAMQAIEI